MEAPSEASIKPENAPLSISIASTAQTPRRIGLKLGSFDTQMSTTDWLVGFVPLLVQV